MLDHEECALALQYLFAGSVSLGFNVNCFKVGSSTREDVKNETFDDDSFFLEVLLSPIFLSKLQCSARFSFEWCINLLFLLGLKVPSRFNIQGIKIQFKGC